MWRAYIAQQKYRVVIDGLKNVNDDDALQAISKVAEYFANPNNRSSVIQYFDVKFAKQFDDDHKEIWCILAASLYYNEGLYENALK